MQKGAGAFTPFPIAPATRAASDGTIGVACGTPHTAPGTPRTVLLTVRQLAEQQPALSEGGIRWAIFHAKDNGLADSGAVIRVGRRVLIDPDLFVTWLRTSPKLSPPKGQKPKRVRARRRVGGGQ